jgi:hypothetical protein
MTIRNAMTAKTNLLRAALPLLALAACGTASNAPVPPDPAAPAWGVLPDAGAAAPAGGIGWPQTPAWAPAYPGAVVDIADTGAGGGTISFRSNDPPAMVISFYRDRARRAGLPLRASSSTGTQRELDAGADQRSLMVNAAALNGGSVVSLVFHTP